MCHFDIFKTVEHYVVCYNRSMRLSSYEVEAIKKSFVEIFGEGKIYLFGSRVEDRKRGGDIDLYLVPKATFTSDELLRKKIAFKLKLYDRLGEQKIDVIFAKDRHRLIEKEAMAKGVLL